MRARMDVSALRSTNGPPEESYVLLHTRVFIRSTKLGSNTAVNALALPNNDGANARRTEGGEAPAARSVAPRKARGASRGAQRSVALG